MLAICLEPLSGHPNVQPPCIQMLLLCRAARIPDAASFVEFSKEKKAIAQSSNKLTRHVAPSTEPLAGPPISCAAASHKSAFSLAYAGFLQAVLCGQRMALF
jgi:hypothetical protein